MQDESLIQAHIVSERAIDEWRRQCGVWVEGSTGLLMAVFPAEFAGEEVLSQFQSFPQRLLLTGARAQSLGLQTDAQGIAIDAATLTLAQIRQLSHPLAEKTSLEGIEFTPVTRDEALLLRLARHAAILPALLLASGLPSVSAFTKNWLSIRTQAIEAYLQKPLLGVIAAAKARLPVEAAENAKLISFRSCYGTAVHLALVIGDIAPVAAPLTRIHSSCATGDIFGSLRCDCGAQLHMAIQHIATEGSGIILYLHQEGRGIGITNKLHAYRLQEQGYDTYDANHMLGFDADERDFAIAAAMLTHLEKSHIRLLTNNPHKLEAVERAGVTVEERVPLIAGSGRHNRMYLEAKANKSGHLLTE